MKLPGIEAERAASAHWRGELTALLGPAVWRVWLLLALLSGAAGLVWRLSGTAPDPLRLADGLGAALWLAALWLAPAWERVTRRYAGRPAPLARGLGIAAVTACAVVASFTPIAVLLAYSPSAKLAEVNPLGSETLTVTMPRVLLDLLPLSGAPLLLGGIGLLLCLRRLAGERGGTALWLMAGLPLHLPLFTGSAPLGALGAGAVLRVALTQIVSTELRPAEIIFEPLRPWLIGAWVVALVLIALSTYGRRPRPQALSPLLLAIGGGCAVAVLRAALLLTHWAADRAQLTADLPLGALDALLLTTGVLWLTLAPWQPPAALARDLRQQLPWLGYAGALALLLDLPLRMESAAAPGSYVLACACGMVLLGGALALATLLLRVGDRTAVNTGPRPALAHAGPGMWRVVVTGLLLAAGLLPSGVDGAALLTLPAAVLSAAAFVPEQQALAWTAGGVLLVASSLALLALGQRRYRAPRRQHPALAAPPATS